MQRSDTLKKSLSMKLRDKLNQDLDGDDTKKTFLINATERSEKD
jgi:hypothetical protein